MCNEFGIEVIKKRNLATKAKILKAMFKEADKEIPNISMLFILVEPSHLTISQIPLIHLLLLLMKKIKINNYKDSQLVELNVYNSLQLRDVDKEETSDD
ncbi:uncharacterized protein OCT59_004795 [Rhizophagus irregularis]|uniref:uncharacterized protein n=1 Tax=Rhizophagus irregularis TaxID=588596 RepID=UPI00331AB7D2|nr:hypothetical protein OCT59_004795 [Rhizophagus irregularis]